MSNQYFNRDMQIFIDHRVDWQRLFELGRDEPTAVEAELETYRMILGTVADVCTDIEEGAREHWHEEPRLEDGNVVLPAHVTAGYERLRDAGLLCLTLGAEHGGYGLPVLLNTFYLEMVSRADTSLMTLVGLQSGVAQDIDSYGDDAVKATYLPRFIAGELTGAMDLTEAGAGSDLGSIATRATEKGDGYVVDGEKIFITNGGADVHLVLARDDATFGETRGTTDGLNLILCPTVLEDGSANGVRVSRVEEKLGLHGSATCVVEFDGAEGVLLGKRGDGFRAMLNLMNNARLGVAAQAIGIAEAAYHEAIRYATDRVQFGIPILDQPLVKSMLTLMAVNIQSARALVYRTSAMIDMRNAMARKIAAGDTDEALAAEHKHHDQLIRFLTPLCKYYAAEISDTVTRKSIQIHGGIGYMAETRAGHHHSDSIITTIYEGTSEIQATFALKEMARGTLITALEDARGELDGLREAQPELVEAVCKGIDWINQSLPALMGGMDYALLNAKRIAEMVIDVVASVELIQQAPVEPQRLALAEAFVNRRMLQVEMSARRIETGDATRIAGYNTVLGV